MKAEGKTFSLATFFLLLRVYDMISPRAEKMVCLRASLFRGFLPSGADSSRVEWWGVRGRGGFSGSSTFFFPLESRNPFTAKRAPRGIRLHDEQKSWSKSNLSRSFHADFRVFQPPRMEKGKKEAKLINAKEESRKTFMFCVGSDGISISHSFSPSSDPYKPPLQSYNQASWACTRRENLFASYARLSSSTFSVAVFALFERLKSLDFG